jgi:subtilisin family serine protease/flagellar hook assembly protein FlgD
VGGLALALGVAGPAAAGVVPAPLSAHAPSTPARHAGGSRAADLHRVLDRGATTRLAVTLAAGADWATVAGSAQGASVAHHIAPLHALSLAVPSSAAEAVARALSHRPDVERVEALPVRHAFADPNDPFYSSQQGYLTAIHAPDAWALTHGAASVRVAVIDTGVDVGHPDLVGKVALAHNSMSTAPSPTDVTDAVGHGTHVAGIVAAASNNAVGVTGTGYDTSILAVKAGDVDGFSDDDIAAGILWATQNGARVINMSLGGPGTTTVLTNAVSYAQAHDVLVVAAAGNDGETTLNYPAALPGVVSVGATDAFGNRASFSNYGSWVSVAAPGVGIWSTVPTAGSEIESPSDGYAAIQGTSMASPIVAGEAGLLLGLEPTLTQAQLRNAIVSSASSTTLGFNHGLVDLAAAFTKIPPASVPTISAPGSGATVGGLVQLTASTTAASVQLLLDGAPFGPRRTASTDEAGASWESWGTSDGAHQVAAQDCNAYGCGAASTPVGFTLQNAVPTVTAPADSSTVSDNAAVTIAVSDAAPKVQLRVDGVAVGTPVAVTTGSATASWPTAGWAEGAHAVTASACTSTGACGAAGPAVSLLVDNAAPVITAPQVGQIVSGSFTLAATATSGALQFLVDGTQVGFDSSPPYAVPVNFSAFADGSHVLKVQPCTTSKSQCAGPSVSRTITVKSLHPSITLAKPAVFSPNGDKRADTTTLTYALPDTESVWWGIKSSSGAVVRGPYYLGTLTKGSRTFLWNGNLANGTRAPNGTYTAYVTTKAVVSGSTLYGYATRYVRLDTVAPSLSVVAPATGFYPYTDGYRDSVVAKATTNEPGLLTLTARSSTGSVVRTVTVNHSGTGTYNLTWNGRDTSGHLVPAGTYRLQVTTQDVALNRRVSSTYNVVVSLKKLVGTTVSKVVTPVATQGGGYVGDCSAIQSSSTWTGAYVYLSDYYGCWSGLDGDDSDVAVSNHTFTLPAAIKYAGISLTATGQETLAGYGDTAGAFLVDTSGNAYGTGAQLGSAYGAHLIGTVPTSLLYGGRTIRWFNGTVYGAYYTIRAFTVRYTYYVLK